MSEPEKLRIAVLSRNFVSTGGGAERYSIALVEQFADKHEVHVFAQTISHNHPKVQYHKVGMPLTRPRWINQLYFATATWWATRKGFDIVHSHENTWHGNVQTVHVLPVKYNLFHNRHGFRRVLRWIKVLTSPRLIAYLALEKARFSVNKPRTIVSVSQTLNDVMLQTYPNAAGALHVIPPGIDSVPGLASPQLKAEAREKLKLPAKGHCILFVGNDFKKKGLPTLIQAMAKLPADVFLAVAGHSRQRAEMDRLVSEFNLEKRIYFLGSVSNMDNAYNVADCLVHPTLEDTYAMVVLEAMAHGLPVVVSCEKYCGVSSELTHKSNALLLQNPQDKDELERACREILFNNVSVNVLKQKSLSFVKNKLWQKAAYMHSTVYKNFIAF